MPVILKDPCRVVDLKEGEPLTRGTLRLWRHFGRHAGSEAISLLVLEFAPGASPGLRWPCDTVLYVLEGRGTVRVDGRDHEVDAETGIHAAPQAQFSVLNPGPDPLLLAAAPCPDPGAPPRFEEPEPPRPGAAGPAPVVRLWEQEPRPTADRWYRVLLDERHGSGRVTQFVGAIPPGRAPDHFHDYEEVLVILKGRGRMWADEASAPIGPGSCVFLPRRQTHCTENTGSDELQLLGMFYPAGSPAVRYDTG